MKPKHILILSVLAGLLAVVLVQVQLRTERGETVTLFRATKTSTAGQTLAGRLEPVTLPGDKLFPNLLKEAPTVEMRDYVTSTPLRETVHEGQVVLYRHLEATSDPGPRGKIPAGQKAFSIEVDAASAVSFLIEPQDRVDVIGALPDPSSPTAQSASSGASGSIGLRLGGLEQALKSGSGSEAQLLQQLVGSLPTPPSTAELRTEVLLENVEVLAVGRRYRRSQPQERGSSYDTVTLLVSPEQAKTLAYARDVHNSPMTLVLRGHDGDAAP